MAESITDEFGSIDHVVAIAGGWWNGKKVWDITQEDWQKAFVGPATTHMALLRALVPKLASNGSYTTIAGFLAHEAYPDSGIVSMQGAARLMMRRALSVELKEVGLAKRANELMLGPVVNRSRPNGKDNWLTADQVGEVAVAVMSRNDITNQEVDIQTTDRLARFLEG
ncbi:hypothetical protein CATYP_06030 [Corynebacterium atypicum]|uniref:Uncharacterized protein n=2 Tax=Corynebacterium atypicum TaxID=191610 RepID=A0ABN4DDE0_9CORY|nr:hypothetical protein CATYP_06030 [Corynebacterium atypicum]